MSECIFCQEVSGVASMIFQFSGNGLWAARWDSYPALPGHTEVIPTRHVDTFMELRAEELRSKDLFIREVMETIVATDLSALYESLLSPHSGITDRTSRELLQRAYARTSQGGIVVDGWTFAINDGAASGRTVGHFHEHIIPRQEGDVPDPRGGFRRMFPDDLY